MAWYVYPGLILPKGHLSFVDKWPMMNPHEIAFLLSTYLFFVLKIGPMLMVSRKPVPIKGFLVLYNTIKVINSGVLAYKFLFYIIDEGLFPRKCEHDDVTLNIIANLYWNYMTTKILDLCDTIFFIIRKKYNQVTFLHVYHHTFMVAISWSCLKYDPSDHWVFMAVMNCAIHTVMYMYYAIAVLGPRFAWLLWWKKYLTMMQLIQFVLVIAHVLIQTYTSECPMHKGSYWIGLSNLALFICLFVNFYKKRYRVDDKTSFSLSCTKQVIE